MQTQAYEMTVKSQLLARSTFVFPSSHLELLLISCRESWGLMDHTAGFLRRPPYPRAVVLTCGLVRRELQDRHSDRAAPPPGWRDGQAEFCLQPREPGVVCLPGDWSCEALSWKDVVMTVSASEHGAGPRGLPRRHQANTFGS